MACCKHSTTACTCASCDSGAACRCACMLNTRSQQNRIDLKGRSTHHGAMKQSTVVLLITRLPTSET